MFIIKELPKKVFIAFLGKKELKANEKI